MPRVINIRGTSGSGKSYLVREVMRRCGESEQEYAGEVDRTLFGDPSSKARIIGHRFRREPELVVAGNYNVATGGCDDLMKMATHGSRDAVFAQLRQWHARGADVLFEGLLISEVARTIQLHRDGVSVLVVHLDVQLETCLMAVQARREARGNTKPLDPYKTTVKHKEILNQVTRLREAGVDTCVAGRDAALQIVCEALGC